MRFTVDTNILVYALSRDEPGKRDIADRVLTRGRLLGMILLAQTLGEFLNAIRRKYPIALDHVLELVELWPKLYAVVPIRADHIAVGGHLAIRHRLRFWDSVILAIARSESVGVLLSEDMQDGATIDGVTILNPFNPANRPALDSLLAG